MRLMAVFVAILIVFGTLVFMAAMVPTMTGLLDAFAGVDGVPDETTSTMDTVVTISLRIVPVLFIVTAMLFAYASAASRQRFVGGGRL